MTPSSPLKLLLVGFRLPFALFFIPLLLAAGCAGPTTPPVSPTQAEPIPVPEGKLVLLEVQVQVDDEVCPNKGIKTADGYHYDPENQVLYLADLEPAESAALLVVYDAQTLCPVGEITHRHNVAGATAQVPATLSLFGAAPDVWDYEGAVPPQLEIQTVYANGTVTVRFHGQESTIAPGTSWKAYSYRTLSQEADYMTSLSVSNWGLLDKKGQVRRFRYPTLPAPVSPGPPTPGPGQAPPTAVVPAFGFAREGGSN